MSKLIYRREVQCDCDAGKHIGASFNDDNDAFWAAIEEKKLCAKERAEYKQREDEALARMARNVKAVAPLQWSSDTPLSDSLARRAGL